MFGAHVFFHISGEFLYVLFAMALSLLNIRSPSMGDSKFSFKLFICIFWTSDTKLWALKITKALKFMLMATEKPFKIILINFDLKRRKEKYFCSLKNMKNSLWKNIIYAHGNQNILFRNEIK